MSPAAVLRYGVMCYDSIRFQSVSKMIGNTVQISYIQRLKKYGEVDFGNFLHDGSSPCVC